jgi:hypothetical protein
MSPFWRPLIAIVIAHAAVAPPGAVSPPPGALAIPIAALVVVIGTGIGIPPRIDMTFQSKMAEFVVTTVTVCTGGEGRRCRRMPFAHNRIASQ